MCWYWPYFLSKLGTKLVSIERIPCLSTRQNIWVPSIKKSRRQEASITWLVWIALIIIIQPILFRSAVAEIKEALFPSILMLLQADFTTTTNTIVVRPFGTLRPFGTFWTLRPFGTFWTLGPNLAKYYFFSAFNSKSRLWSTNLNLILRQFDSIGKQVELLNDQIVSFFEVLFQLFNLRVWRIFSPFCTRRSSDQT